MNEYEMEGDIDIMAMPLASLPHRTRDLLSCLLDSTKLFPSDGPDKLPRDWRGLASLISISAEIATSIKEYNEKTKKVLEIWVLRQDGTSTVGQLLNYLQRLDRYDVHDDILEDLKDLASKGELFSKPQNQVALNNNRLIDRSEFGPITYQDSLGHAQHYDAFVLYAQDCRADKAFVDELLRRLRGEGFLICTVDDLLPGHATQYAPVSQLISKRCQCIILIYSPEFLLSPANSFYRDYAQALSIETNQRKIIPIMYRECQLPVHLTYYHRLYYNGEGRAMYDFWHKLSQSLARTPVINGAVSMSGLNIEELMNVFTLDDSRLFLPAQHNRSLSIGAIDMIAKKAHDDCTSVSTISDISQTSAKKKRGPIRQLFSNLLKRKNKKAIMVEN